MRVDEPVLIIAFNRPHYLRALIERLREIRPMNVFVAIDGPRFSADEIPVNECRMLVDMIDWTPNVRTQFQDVNLGCGKGVAAAITWFFENVDRGIILEDDIIPEPSFFRFCIELLDRYELDDRVFAVSGSNHVPEQALSNPSDAYRFSQVTSVWGWATWKRVWIEHSLSLDSWFRRISPASFWRAAGKTLPGCIFWAARFEAVRRGKLDTWDYQLVFTSMKNCQLTATSNVNLITNIGFGVGATHTIQGSPGLRPVGVAQIPSIPISVAIDRKADDWSLRKHWNATYRGMFHRSRKVVSNWKNRT